MNLEEIKLATEPYINKLTAMKSAGEIREFLAVEGIKAVPTEAGKCAVAAYIQQGSGYRVIAFPISGFFYPTCKPRNLLADSTPAIKEFIIRFDFGRYPELVAK